MPAATRYTVRCSARTIALQATNALAPCTGPPSSWNNRADLDAIVPKPHALWFPEDLEGWQARWVIVQTIAEIARHAGHADIIREALDGKKSYELNDRSDGVLADDEEYVAWG